MVPSAPASGQWGGGERDTATVQRAPYGAPRLVWILAVCRASDGMCHQVFSQLEPGGPFWSVGGRRSQILSETRSVGGGDGGGAACVLWFLWSVFKSRCYFCVVKCIVFSPGGQDTLPCPGSLVRPVSSTEVGSSQAGLDSVRCAVGALVCFSPRGHLGGLRGCSFPRPTKGCVRPLPGLLFRCVGSSL